MSGKHKKHPGVSGAGCPPGVDGMMRKENWPELMTLTSYFPVELPRIEPAANIGLTCANARFGYAKRHGVTCGYAKGVDGVNMPRAAFLLVRLYADRPSRGR